MIQFLSATGSTSMTETLFTLLPMILIIVFMFILIYLPQKRQDKKDAAMRSSIEIGDKVSTIGGIVGIVCAISEKDDTIVLETGSDRTKIRFRRTAISSVEKLDMAARTPPLLRSNFAQRAYQNAPLHSVYCARGRFIMAKSISPNLPRRRSRPRGQNAPAWMLVQVFAAGVGLCLLLLALAAFLLTHTPLPLHLVQPDGLPGSISRGCGFRLFAGG